MSRGAGLLVHPVNGSKEQIWEGFSWPAFFFGVLWLLVKGLYGHFLISLLLLGLSFGFGAPIIWLVYGFIGNDAHKKSLVKKGYLTLEQWNKKSQADDVSLKFNQGHNAVDSVDKLRALAELKEKGYVTDDEFLVQKAKILGG